VERDPVGFKRVELFEHLKSIEREIRTRETLIKALSPTSPTQPIPAIVALTKGSGVCWDAFLNPVSGH